MPRPKTPLPPAAAAPPMRRAARTPVEATDTPPLICERRPNPWLRRALIFATCVLLVDAFIGEAGLATKWRARDGYAATEADLQRLREENAGLLEQIRRLQYDPAAIEEVAREELGLMRPGEVLFVVRNAG